MSLLMVRIVVPAATVRVGGFKAFAEIVIHEPPMLFWLLPSVIVAPAALSSPDVTKYSTPDAPVEPAPAVASVEALPPIAPAVNVAPLFPIPNPQRAISVEPSVVNVVEPRFAAVVPFCAADEIAFRTSSVHGPLDFCKSIAITSQSLVLPKLAENMSFVAFEFTMHVSHSMMTVPPNTPCEVDCNVHVAAPAESVATS